MQKKKEDLPVDYYWHSIWNDFLKNGGFLFTNVNAELSHAKVHYLPANTTAHLQPCDAGIINLFKITLTCIVSTARKQVLNYHVNNKKQSMLDGFVIRM